MAASVSSRHRAALAWGAERLVVPPPWRDAVTGKAMVEFSGEDTRCPVSGGASGWSDTTKGSRAWSWDHGKLSPPSRVAQRRSFGEA